MVDKDNKDNDVLKLENDKDVRKFIKDGKRNSW